MKKILFLITLIVINIQYALGTTYNYISSNGVSTYTMPTQVTTAATTGTQMTGQLAGDLAASSAARSTGNPAAIMGTQNALINTGAGAISAAITSAISPMFGKSSP